MSEQLQHYLKILSGIKKEQRVKMKDDLKEHKKAMGNLNKAKNRYEEALKALETYKAIHEAVTEEAERP